MKVFPERFDKREKGNRGKTPDEVKQLLRGEASRFNGSKIISEIRRVATIPVSLIHRHLLHDAILQTANLMTSAKSEMVRQKAADTLIRELKPTEDAVISMKADDATISVIESLRLATQELAAKQHDAIKAGIPIKQISQAKIMIDEEDIIDVEAIEVVEDEVPVDKPQKNDWKLGG